MDKRTILKNARRCIYAIENCEELKQLELNGFIGGISKGKCPTILGDTLSFLFEDLEKQMFDYHLALYKRDYKSIRKCLADLRNVAGCIFIKLIDERDHMFKLRET